MDKNIKRILREKFALRLRDAYERSPNTLKGHGTYVWVKDRMGDRGIKVTAETVRRWFCGLVTPRPYAMQALANIVGVSPGFLAHGTIGEDAKVSEPHILELAYAESAANRSEIASSYVAGRLGMMGMTVHRSGSSVIEVVFGAKRRVLINVVYAERDVKHFIRIDLPEPDRMTGSYHPLFIVVSNGPEEPYVYFFSAHEASLLGHGERRIFSGGNSIDIEMKNNKVRIDADKRLKHVIGMI